MKNLTLNYFGLMDFCDLHCWKIKRDSDHALNALLKSSVHSNGSCASQQFGEAYDTLLLRKLEKLEVGMRHAIKIQRVILRPKRLQYEVVHTNTGADVYVAYRVI